MPDINLIHDVVDAQTTAAEHVSKCKGHFLSRTKYVQFLHKYINCSDILCKLFNGETDNDTLSLKYIMNTMFSKLTSINGPSTPQDINNFHNNILELFGRMEEKLSLREISKLNVFNYGSGIEMPVDARITKVSWSRRDTPIFASMYFLDTIYKQVELLTRIQINKSKEEFECFTFFAFVKKPGSSTKVSLRKIHLYNDRIVLVDEDGDTPPVSMELGSTYGIKVSYIETDHIDIPFRNGREFRYKGNHCKVDITIAELRTDGKTGNFKGMGLRNITFYMLTYATEQIHHYIFSYHTSLKNEHSKFRQYKISGNNRSINKLSFTNMVYAKSVVEIMKCKYATNSTENIDMLIYGLLEIRGTPLRSPKALLKLVVSIGMMGIVAFLATSGIAGVIIPPLGIGALFGTVLLQESIFHSKRILQLNRILISSRNGMNIIYNIPNKRSTMIFNEIFPTPKAGELSKLARRYLLLKHRDIVKKRHLSTIQRGIILERGNIYSHGHVNTNRMDESILKLSTIAELFETEGSTVRAPLNDVNYSCNSSFIEMINDTNIYSRVYNYEHQQAQHRALMRGHNLQRLSSMTPNCAHIIESNYKKFGISYYRTANSYKNYAEVKTTEDEKILKGTTGGHIVLWEG